MNANKKIAQNKKRTEAVPVTKLARGVKNHKIFNYDGLYG